MFTNLGKFINYMKQFKNYNSLTEEFLIFIAEIALGCKPIVCIDIKLFL